MAATKAPWVVKVPEGTLFPICQKLPVNRFAPKFSAQALNNQTDWPVIFRLTGPICARALNRSVRTELAPLGHHDWPVKRVIRLGHRERAQISEMGIIGS
jgi:hypothetical protein